jgi:hypothetical protein
VKDSRIGRKTENNPPSNFTVHVFLFTNLPNVVNSHTGFSNIPHHIAIMDNGPNVASRTKCFLEKNHISDLP